MSRDISVMSLFAAVKREWKKAVLLFLLGLFSGVGLGVFWGHVKKSPAWSESAAIEKTIADMQEYQTVKSASEAIIKNNSILLQKLNEHESKSILTDVNAWSVPMYEMTVQIIADDTEKQRIAGEYLLLFESGDFFDGIRKVLGEELENQYIEELITVTYRSQTSTVIIKVIHNNLSDAKRMAEYAWDFMQMHAPAMNTDHSLKLSNAIASAEENVSLIELRERRKKERAAYISAIAKEKDKLANLIEPSDAAGLQAQSRNQELTKYSLLGILSGVFLSSMWLLGKAVSPDSPISMEDVARYSLPILYDGRKQTTDKKLHIVEAKKMIETLGEVYEGLIILGMCGEDMLQELPECVVLERGMLKEAQKIHKLYRQKMIFLLNPDMVSLRELDNIVKVIEKLEASVLGVIVIQ